MNLLRFIYTSILCFLMFACSQYYKNNYNDFNTTDMQKPTRENTKTSGDYFIVFLVDSPHFDYSSTQSLFRNLAKNPSTKSKDGYVGHAWIYLFGYIKNKEYIIEGGHSGETGLYQPKYLDGVMNYIQYGYSYPTLQEHIHEENPIKYLWASQHDGFFQYGSGNHTPTYAAKVCITKNQFENILDFIHPDNYSYTDYALSRNQCSSFLAQVAAIINFPLEHEISIPLSSHLKIDRYILRLWSDPRYSSITFSSPDILEKSLKQAVKSGYAQDVLDWYIRNNHKKSMKNNVKKILMSIIHFPGNLRQLMLYNKITECKNAVFMPMKSNKLYD